MFPFLLPSSNMGKSVVAMFSLQFIYPASSTAIAALEPSLAVLCLEDRRLDVDMNTVFKFLNQLSKGDSEQIFGVRGSNLAGKHKKI